MLEMQGAAAPPSECYCNLL